MVTTAAILHGDRRRFLDYHPREQPLALQLGGSDPSELAACARLAEQWGYNEVNLNCGCPSDRVQSGQIGACLMAQPALVADCVKAMRDAVSIPVTVKHRIGIDDMEDYAGMADFVQPLAAAGCDTFIVHARKAWLQGLSPKENREKPPLQYDKVYRLKQDFPRLEIIINGGITTLAQCRRHLDRVDGVMMGREAYNNPFVLAEVDRSLYGDKTPPPARSQVMDAYIDYCEAQLRLGTRLHHMSRHVLGLFQGQPGARRFRRYISENAHKPNAGIDVLTAATQLLQCSREAV